MEEMMNQAMETAAEKAPEIIEETQKVVLVTIKPVTAFIAGVITGIAVTPAAKLFKAGVGKICDKYEECKIARAEKKAAKESEKIIEGDFTEEDEEEEK